LQWIKNKTRPENNSSRASLILGRHIHAKQRVIPQVRMVTPWKVTCYFFDGSTRIIRNNQYRLAAIGGMFGLGGLIGFVISIPLFLLPFILI